MPAQKAKHFSELIAALYDTAIEPVRWQTVGEQLANYFNGPSGKIQIRSPNNGTVESLSATTNYSSALTQAWQNYYYQLDLWVKGLNQRPAGQATNSHEIVTEAEMLSSEWYNDFLKPLGDVFYGIGVKIPLNSQGDFAVVSVHHLRHQQPFTADEKRHLQLLVPHLQRTLQLRQYLTPLTAGHAVHIDMLAALSIGVLVTNAAGRLLFANRRGETILNDGRCISARMGFLQIPMRILNERFAQMISDVASTPQNINSRHSGGWLSIPREGKRPLRLLICPLPRSIFPRSGAMIFLHDAEKSPRLSMAALIKLYRLTPTEAHLAHALVDGVSLTAFALVEKISLHTAKNSVKRILEKSGHSRQIDFVRDVLSNPLLALSEESLRDG